MQLDTHFQLPKFLKKMIVETIDSWLRSLSTYFKTCLEMEEDMKLQFEILQLEGIGKDWRNTQLDNFSETDESTETQITSWDNFFQVLHDFFYPPGYL